MFTIYDLNFNKISLPVDDLGYGLKGLDVYISSTRQEVTERTIAGVAGSVITGYRDSDRDFSIHARLKAKDAIDFRLKRDRVFSFFKRLGDFYITENQQGNKLMKVRVVESYSFERPDNLQTFATVDIPLKIIGQPYWISRFKSTDLHGKEGIDFNSNWSFGMGLDVNKLQYQFENKSSFTVFNAGTVPLKTIQEKDNCIITIEINQSVTHFKLYDATGRYFEYNPTQESDWSLKSGDKLVLNGHYMTLNSTPIMERTNRYFLQLLAGDNAFTVEGLATYKITFDFQFKYD